MQFLPQPQQQQPKPEQQQEIVQFTPSPQLLRLTTVTRLGIYGFWFLLGVCGVNLSRLIPHAWIVYWVLLLAAAGWLLLVPSQDEGVVATRRISGFALLLSVSALWDLLATIPFLPIHVLQWIFPLWQCVGLGIVGLILIAVFLMIVS